MGELTEFDWVTFMKHSGTTNWFTVPFKLKDIHLYSSVCTHAVYRHPEQTTLFAVSDLWPIIKYPSVLNNDNCVWTAAAVISFLVWSKSRILLSVNFFSAFMCISLGCGLVSGKCDCLSLLHRITEISNCRRCSYFGKILQVLVLNSVQNIFIAYKESLTAFISSCSV